MKISELMMELMKIKETYGDLPIEGSFEGCTASCELSIVKAKGKIPIMWDQKGNPLAYRDGYPEETTLFIGEKTDGEYF